MKAYLKSKSKTYIRNYPAQQKSIEQYRVGGRE
jgi:hypothetical protein